MIRLLLAALALAPAGPATAASAVATAHPEARPFGHPGRARQDVRGALARSAMNGHRVLLIFGLNGCHDSRALAGWFATPRFRTMLATVTNWSGSMSGNKDRNLDLARDFGLDGIAGTPTVLILNGLGRPLNLADAPSWRNAATRSEDAIFAAFAGA